jgi:hypothetical protein
MIRAWRRKIRNQLSISNLFILLRPGKSARPAPAELPQDRKVARVGGCSGAMFGLPLFISIPGICIPNNTFESFPLLTFAVDF